MLPPDSTPPAPPSDIWPKAVDAMPGASKLEAPTRATLARLLQILESGRSRLNLTTITDPAEMATLHLADSLAALDAEPNLRSAATAADIGTGAGFPMLPLAIVLADCAWTGIESVAKKCRFIEDTARELRLNNITTVPIRAEDAGRGDLRETFDIVTARAVGPIAALLEVGLPLLRPGGRLLLYKTESANEEWKSSEPILQTLGGRPLDAYRYAFPGDRLARVIFRCEAIASTDEKYPRPAGVPFKRPLKV